MLKSKSIHNDEYRRFITELVDERKRLKLSQVEVATLLKMTQSDISKIENTDRRLDVLELRNLLKIYKINKDSELAQSVMKFFDIDL